jgi:hypothetical protein
VLNKKLISVNNLSDSAFEEKPVFLFGFLRISYLGLLYILKIIVILSTFLTPSSHTVGKIVNDTFADVKLAR